MNKFKLQLLKLFLDHPLDFNIYLDGYNNKDYAYRVIKSFIPTDTGIEWEVGDAMVRSLTHRNRASWLPHLHCESSFEVTYRIRHASLNKHLSQLMQMYAFMDKPSLASQRQEKSGIHIHTNLIKLAKKDSIRKLILDRESVTRKAVRCIATEFFRYGGTYNTLKFDWNKGNAIIHRSEYNTIEYRCINMTWDFRELLKYIVTCHHMTNLFLQYGNNKLSGDEFLDKVEAFIECTHEL
jgi:hypothetical protein